MPTIIFIRPDGSEIPVSAPVGGSVMRLAIQYNIPGIVGECGGAMACATCHVFVDPTPTLSPLGVDEDAMLMATAVPRTGRSRLACQIQIEDDLDGLRVELPERQV